MTLLERHNIAETKVSSQDNILAHCIISAISLNPVTETKEYQSPFKDTAETFNHLQGAASQYDALYALQKRGISLDEAMPYGWRNLDKSQYWEELNQATKS